ncbi:Prolyl oligopeptidase [Chthoniobacter flavus Ellin428]|uniref:prolyl oligopeptidase n=1 Tax=Chthoniobacter flavus Ellin428 TaxID=497964 RepID=B4DC96_9BACT|nr:prolyl oligopeptidase family serine peptidase [Chthoniobacter flavus]EDY15926.1 Prolyl oligopeptidase [Chthoniobacter flavus Ellin428]TCO82517.1 prolyl oligopeptidase [Chthoniobacter flavus]
MTTLPSRFALCGALLLVPAVLLADDTHLPYPVARKSDQVDDYHGVKIADPYRWLEDDNSAETKAWVEAENKVTFAYLDTIPERAAIKERLTKLWNYERFGVPFHEGGRYFFTRNSGLQNQRVLYVAEKLDATPRVLLDPNTLSTDGTVALSGYSPSEDGKYLAYGLSKAGSDWEEYHVRDVATGEDREDLVEWVKFSGASWKKDGSGFYYSRYDAPKPGEEKKGLNEFQKLYFHRLGSKQSEDVLVYERHDHADWGFNGNVTDDGHYLIIHVSQGTDSRNRVFFKDLADEKSPVVELLNDFDASYDFIDNIGPVFYFKTDLDASRGRVIAIDTAHPQRNRWVEVIPQEKVDALEGVSVVHDQFICTYLHDAHSVVRLFNAEATDGPAKFLRELALPSLGSAGGFGGKRKDTETFYSFTSFTVPGTIYRLDLTAGESAVFREPHVDFNPNDYETKQVFYKSKDGTRVPMFITYKRGLKLDGANPTLLYAYGGFDISLTPRFNVADLVWMERGGVFAMPNLRGGGEYGEEWHQAGMILKKQNVFDDFIAAAEWLIENKYTCSQKLAVQGGSNGGLLIGACLTQRPELFGAALPAVGVMDMLRFDKFTIGWAWRSEYGSASNPEQFRALYAYSPLQAIKPGVRYPATLVATADHDDRVVPAHSFKFAARLQECQAKDGPPVLIRIETRAGHGGNKPMTKVIAERADEIAFMLRSLGMN